MIRAQPDHRLYVRYIIFRILMTWQYRTLVFIKDRRACSTECMWVSLQSIEHDKTLIRDTLSWLKFVAKFYVIWNPGCSFVQPHLSRIHLHILPSTTHMTNNKIEISYAPATQFWRNKLTSYLIFLSRHSTIFRLDEHRAQ